MIWARMAALTGILVGLKTVGIISWPWFFVMTPLWIIPVACGALIFLMTIAGIILECIDP